ncbi:MAG: hypothetical protein ACI4MK_05400, partial [Aristaeellaceae bacterium]
MPVNKPVLTAAARHGESATRWNEQSVFSGEREKTAVCPINVHDHPFTAKRPPASLVMREAGGLYYRFFSMSTMSAKVPRSPCQGCSPLG